MTWKDVAGLVSKVAPALGGVLGGSAGAAAGELLAKALGVESSPDKVLDALKSDPASIVKLRELESNERIRIQELSLQADTTLLQAINETMRVETTAIGQAWYQKAWRPACGFSVALGSFLSILFVMYLFYAAMTNPALGINLPGVIAMIPQLALSVGAILSIPGAAVGISAWHRGKMQRERVQAGEGE